MKNAGNNALTNTVLTNTVTLQIDAEQYSMAVVEFAVDIAAIFKKSLHGRFIEDSTLLQISDLPCSKEICSLSAVEHEISVDSMKRSLRATAEIFKKNLAQFARQSSINWSYDYISSTDHPAPHTQPDATPATQQADYVIYHRASRLRINPLHKAKQKILVVDHNSSLLAGAVEALLHKLKNCNLEIILVTDTTPDSPLRLLLSEDQASNTLVTSIAMSELVDSGYAREQFRALDCALIAEASNLAANSTILEHLACPIVLVCDKKTV